MVSFRLGVVPGGWVDKKALINYHSLQITSKRQINMVPLRKAIAMTGLTGNTLRKYADSGTIPSMRTPGGQRLFDIDAWLRGGRPAAVVGYCRVSSPSQRGELDRQVERLRRTRPEAEIIKDIGSGLDFERPGLRRLLERILRGDCLVVLVTRADRLASFGSDAIRFLLEKNGGELLILDRPDSAEAELVEVLAFIHDLCGRENGAPSSRQALETLWKMVDEWQTHRPSETAHPRQHQSSTLP
jgi:predicted site-specific integrase-resolvase